MSNLPAPMRYDFDRLEQMIQELSFPTVAPNEENMNSLEGKIEQFTQRLRTAADACLVPCHRRNYAFHWFDGEDERFRAIMRKLKTVRKRAGLLLRRTIIEIIQGVFKQHYDHLLRKEEDWRLTETVQLPRHGA